MAKRSEIIDAGAGAGAGAGKRHYYKLWVLAVIVLVALWSMFTGSITLRWSVNRFSDDLDSMILEDLDVLEVEEREKVVRHMWDGYTHSRSNSVSLPQFWSEAFQAAYEHLVSDVPAVRNAAVSEIAKMSLALRSHVLHQLPLSLQLESQSQHVQSNRRSRKIKQAESSMDSTVDSNHYTDGRDSQQSESYHL